MIRVVVEISSGSVHPTVAVQAESIEQAVRLATVNYPGGEVQVLFPIDPEAFFVDESAPAPERVMQMGLGRQSGEC